MFSTATLAHRKDGTPYSPVYDDIYYSASGALGQANHVFLQGTGLLEQWSGRRSFTIVETGFGLGLNFLATWLAWRRDPHACERLHFVSLEKHPFSAADLQTQWADSALYADPAAPPGAFSELVEALCKAWPIATGGLHRLEFDGGRVVLTLGIGDALTLARRLRLRGNAFFLDGFAPAKNPDMWDVALFKALARIADEGATIATYTSAGAVRRGLISAGFMMRRAPGFGSKREILVGHFAPRWRVRRHPPPLPAPVSTRDAIVIGAGVAGCAVVERLASRGWQVTLIDRATQVANEASGNPAAVFHPMITRDEGLAARLSRAGFLYALHRWRTLEAAGHPLNWRATGLFQLDGSTDDASEGRSPTLLSDQTESTADESTLTEALIAAPGLPESLARRVDASTAQALSGFEPRNGGWLFPSAGWIDPVSLCHAQLDAAADRLTRCLGKSVDRLERRDGRWHAIDAAGHTIASASILVIANAHDAARLAGLTHAPTEQIRGQLTILPPSAFPALQVPVIGGGYLTPTPNGMLTGASYGVGDTRTAIDPAEHLENLTRLQNLLPAGYPPLDFDIDSLQGRVGFRCVTGDRLPMVGQIGDESRARERAGALTGAQPLDLPRSEGLFGVFGYGSRGLLWSALGAEVIASLVEGEPPPVEADLIDAIDPARFLLRDCRRGKLFRR